MIILECYATESFSLEWNYGVNSLSFSAGNEEGREINIPPVTATLTKVEENGLTLLARITYILCTRETVCHRVLHICM